MEIGVHRHRRFQTQSNFSFAFSRDLIPRNARQECVATMLKVSGLRSMLGPWSLCRHKSVQTVCISCLQAKGRQHHPSQNVSPAVTEFAGPVPEQSSHRGIHHQTIILRLHQTSDLKPHSSRLHVIVNTSFSTLFYIVQLHHLLGSRSIWVWAPV